MLADGLSEASEPNKGEYGRFGGRYVAEALWHPLEMVAHAFEDALGDDAFVEEYEDTLEQRVGRPTPLTPLNSLSDEVGGGRLLLKREDLCHGGSYSANLAVAYALLAKRMGREWLISETATGDFGVALASIGASMDLGVRLFVGRADLEAESLNMRRIEELGGVIETVDTSKRGAKAACAEAMRYWATHSDSSLYCPSQLASPDPYPRLIHRFLSSIGEETRRQAQGRGIDPEYVVAPIGSGAFGVGLLGEFIDADSTQVVGVQAGGDGQGKKHSASLTYGKPGVFQGTYSFVLQDQNGQILSPSSIAAGLCTPIVGPQHARWAQTGAAHYVTSTNQESVAAVRRLARHEGVVVSLEAAHALAYGLKLLPTLSEDEHVIVGISGSGVHELERLAQLEAEGASA
jgi:tryptophan synthase beta chain